MNLEDAILQWNGKSSEQIRAIYPLYCDEPSFLDQLISMLQCTDLQKGASWLLYHHLKLSGTLSQKYSDQVYSTFDSGMDWVTKLSLVKSIQFMPISDQVVLIVEDFLRTEISHENTFVRAWVYHGFYELAVQYEEYRGEVMAYLEYALLEEPASVRARIRQAMKKGF